ncbi:MAG: hypothetical protein OXG78_01285 [Chloroflexi bacterium]|nr:hypothetical protein [Chloroflexota bacterium]
MNALSDANTNDVPPAFENFLTDLLEDDESTAAELPTRLGHDIWQGSPRLLYVEKLGATLNLFLDLRLDRIEQLNIHVLGPGVFEVDNPHTYFSESSFERISDSTASNWLHNAEPEVPKIQLQTQIANVFSLGDTIRVESGMVNDFSLELERLIRNHGKSALDSIQRYILQERTTTYLAMEALKYIGNFRIDALHHQRRKMLERCLRESRFAWVRDGASLGLSFMDDPLSIPALKKAIQRESNQELKEDLIEVLEQLQETRLES